MGTAFFFTLHNHRVAGGKGPNHFRFTARATAFSQYPL